MHGTATKNKSNIVNADLIVLMAVQVNILEKKRETKVVKELVGY